MNGPPQLTCIRCPLCCDDLRNTAGGIDARGCAVGASWFAGLADQRYSASDRGPVPPPGPLPRPSSRPSRQSSSRSDEASIAIVAHGVDHQTAKTLVELRELGRIGLFCANDPSVAAIGLTMRRDGTVMCTMGETRRHADCVWTIGQVRDTWPRFNERLGGDRLAKRGGRWIHDDRVLLRDLPNRLDAIGVAESLHVWVGPGAFAPAEADLAAGTLSRWVRSMNQTRRAYLNTLDASLTLQSVSLWRTNCPVPTISDVGLREPLSDYEFRLGVGIPPADGDGLSLHGFIGPRDPGSDVCDWFAAAAIPGWHVRSQIIRGDGSVTLPLAGMTQEKTLAMSERLQLWLESNPAQKGSG